MPTTVRSLRYIAWMTYIAPPVDAYNGEKPEVHSLVTYIAPPVDAYNGEKPEVHSLVTYIAPPVDAYNGEKPEVHSLDDLYSSTGGCLQR